MREALGIGIVLAFVTGCSADSGDDAAGNTTGQAAPDTWSTFAQSFMSSYCVGCHGPDSTTRNYSQLDDVRRDAAIIRCGVSPVALDDCGAWPPPLQFPIGTGPKPTDEERQRLVDWIAAGLAE